MVLVIDIDEVLQLGRGLEDREGRVLAVINKDRNAAVGVQAQEPLLLLLVGGNVNQCRVPGCAVGVSELLEQNLRRLPVGRVLSD